MEIAGAVELGPLPNAALALAAVHRAQHCATMVSGNVSTRAMSTRSSETGVMR